MITELSHLFVKEQGRVMRKLLKMDFVEVFQTPGWKRMKLTSGGCRLSFINQHQYLKIICHLFDERFVIIEACFHHVVSQQCQSLIKPRSGAGSQSKAVVNH